MERGGTHPLPHPTYPTPLPPPPPWRGLSYLAKTGLCQSVPNEQDYGLLSLYGS